MTKCGACGKFMSPNDCLSCQQCTTAYHRACVAIPPGVPVRNTWLCPLCKIKMPREDNSCTPVKSLAADYGTPPQTTPELDMPKTFNMENIDLGTEMRAFRNELSSIRSDLMADMRSELGSLKADLKTEIHVCRQEVTEFRAALKSYEDQVSAVEKRLALLEAKIADKPPVLNTILDDKIAEIQCQLNEREQELLLNDVEISGVPEHSKESVVHIVKVLSVKLGCDLTDDNIVHIERVGNPRRNRVESESSM